MQKNAYPYIYYPPGGRGGPFSITRSPNTDLKVLISGFAARICEPPVLELAKNKVRCGGEGRSVRYDGVRCAVRFSGSCVPYCDDGGDGDGCTIVMEGGCSKATFEKKIVQ